MPAEDRSVLVDGAIATVCGRAEFIRGIDDVDNIEFSEQSLAGPIPSDHVLHSFADWPDRHAGRGQDFAF